MPISGEQDGPNVSIRIARASEASSTAADGAAGRNVEAAIADVSQISPTDFEDSRTRERSNSPPAWFRLPKRMVAVLLRSSIGGRAVKAFLRTERA